MKAKIENVVEPSHRLPRTKPSPSPNGELDQLAAGLWEGKACWRVRRSYQQEESRGQGCIPLLDPSKI